MDVEIMVPLGAFAMVVAIVWIVQAYVTRTRAEFMKTVRAAIDKGMQLTPEAIRTLGAPRYNRYGDIKWGTIWVSVALACVAFGQSLRWVDAGPEPGFVFLGIASFPGFVGLALLGYGLVMLRVKDE